MGGDDLTFDALVGSALFIAGLWYAGRLFQTLSVSPILAYIIVGVLLGPEGLDLVPFSHCFNEEPTLLNYDFGSTDNSSHAVNQNISSGDDIHIEHVNVWNVAGQLGVTFLIMESGMHLHLDKLRSIGSSFITVAIVGTILPILFGVLVLGLLLEFPLFPDAFAASVALTPTSVGIAVALLSELKKLETDAGQTIVAAAFVDDVLSLVLLVILLNLAASSITVASIILPILYSCLFVAFGVGLGHYAMPRFMVWLLMEKIPDRARASIQPRDQVHITIMMSALVLFAYIGHLIGSHLLGAFVAGLCFVQVPRSTRIFQTQFKRTVTWFIRLFFGATVAFSIPVSAMFNITAFWQGLVCFVLVGVFGKLFSTLHIGQDRWIVGWAMIARGEFGLLVAETALRTPLLTRNADGSTVYMISTPLYATVLWVILLAMLVTPIAFRIVLKRRYKKDSEQGFSMLRVSVQGHHHAGALHEVSSVLHQFGLDISTATVETDGVVDKEVFLAVIRGHRKADRLSNDNVAEMRKMLEEVMLDKAEVLVFPCSDEEMKMQKANMCNSVRGGDNWMEVDIVGDHSDGTLNDVVELLNSFGLEVVRADSKSFEGKDIVHLYAKDASTQTAPLDRQQVRNEVHNVFQKNGIKGQVMVKVIHGNCRYQSDRYVELHSMAHSEAAVLDGLMELRVKGKHVPGLLKAISEALKASHLDVLGAEVVTDNDVEVISYFAKDDEQMSNGMKLVAQSTTDALRAVKTRSSSVASRRSGSSSYRARKAQLLVAPRRQESEVDLESGGAKETDRRVRAANKAHRERHNEAALFHIPLAKPSNFSETEEEGEATEELSRTNSELAAEKAAFEQKEIERGSSFNISSFVALRRGALKSVVESICESFGAKCTVTLRNVNQAFMHEEPDSRRRATILGGIESGKSGEELEAHVLEVEPVQPASDGENDSQTSTETVDTIPEKELSPSSSAAVEP